ncbi:MAG: PAS domain S-box protein [Leptolyngbyaceae cyanobacterium SM1_3_5]|nr:PAS domain S-box protein [Leptolyngbyaceae cyanobacterium SM1_3_5]
MAPLQILCAATKATHALIAQTLAADSADLHPVATLTDLEVALLSDWDAVIVEAIDPAINPLLALQQVRAIGDLPFLVVGYLSAVEAVKLIKAGADDYLELTDLARLPQEIAQLCLMKQKAIEQQQVYVQQEQQLVALRQQLTKQRFQLYCQREQLAQQQLAAIVTATEDGIISLDLEGRILIWNGGAERIYGYSAAEAIGQPLTKLIRPSDDRLWHEAALAGLIAHHHAKHQRKTAKRSKCG